MTCLMYKSEHAWGYSVAWYGMTEHACFACSQKMAPTVPSLLAEMCHPGQIFIHFFLLNHAGCTPTSTLIHARKFDCKEAVERIEMAR